MDTSSIVIEPVFLQCRHGPLFSLLVRPASNKTTIPILYVHPFAEEMHKSRRMAAMTARRAAAEGFAVLMIDLMGCGDSAGDFGEATWEIWTDNIVSGCNWLTARFDGPVTLWGLRIGAMLAAETAAKLPKVTRLLLWQPVINGEVFLKQFLRLKLAEEVVSGGQLSGGTGELLARLDANLSVEIGGYELTASMAHSLSSRRLLNLEPTESVIWLESGPAIHTNPSPASQQVVDAWRKKGAAVQVQTTSCPPFWATQEISECEALVAASVHGLTS